MALILGNWKKKLEQNLKRNNWLNNSKILLYKLNCKVKMLLVERSLLLLKKEIWLVRTNRIGNSLECIKKKLSIKLMGLCGGKVFTAPVCWRNS